MSEQEAVMATLEDYSTAYCSKDIDALMNVFDDGENISLIGTGGDELCGGREAVKKVFLRNFEEATANQFEWHWKHILVTGDQAVVAITLTYSKRGFWILTNGEIKEIDGQHISAVIYEPELFGETLSEIVEIHNHYGEPLHTEKMARNIIMTRILKRGFIRIRERRNDWVLQVWKKSSEIDLNIQGWANFVSDQGDQYADVTIHEMSSNQVVRTSLDRLAVLSPNIRKTGVC